MTTLAINCGKLDISDIPEEEIVAATGYGAWVACEVDEKIYEIAGSPYGYAVIKFNSPCYATPCAEDSSIMVGKAFLMIGNSLEMTQIKSSTSNPSTSSNNDLPGENTTTKTICGIDIELLKKLQETVDSLQMNEKSFQPAAVIPNACVIPMKSNVFTYGPWVSTNFAGTYGGSDLQIDNELNPWNFGSYAGMNEAGQELANTAIAGLSKAEKGSVTLLEMPRFSLGGINNGPLLSDISVTFGSSGATTTYNFATYTPKFGQLSRVIIDKFKKLSNLRNQQLKFLRQNEIVQNKISRKLISTHIPSNLKETSKSLSDKNSLSRVFVGEMFDNHDTLNGDIGQRTIVGMSTLSKSVLEMRGSGYKNKSIMSLDGLYSPVSINGGTDGNLLRFVKAPNYNGIPDNRAAWPISPNPPVIQFEIDANQVIGGTGPQINYMSEAIPIHRDYLNPVANPGTIPFHDGPNAGHCIDMVGRETGLTNNGLITNFYGANIPGKYSNDYRFISMRGPLVLHSWGYDTEGKPVPNEADNEGNTKNGIFTTNNLTNNFMNDWLQKPKTWPVAPVDLRLDRERGVWVSPQPYRIVVLKLLDNLQPFQTAKAALINYGKEITNNAGYPLNDASSHVIVCDRIGSSAAKDSLNYAYFDTYTSQYLLLETATPIRIGMTAGLWPIGTTKTVELLKVQDGTETISSSYDLVSTFETVVALNLTNNLTRSDIYNVILANINGHYFYLGGAGC